MRHVGCAAGRGVDEASLLNCTYVQPREEEISRYAACGTRSE